MDQRGSAQYTKNTKAKLIQIVCMFKKPYKSDLYEFLNIQF